MRRALGVASVLTILSVAGPAPAQTDSVAFPDLPAPAEMQIAGGTGSVDSPFASPKTAWRPTAERVYAVVGEHLVTGVSQPQGFTANGLLVLTDAADPDFHCVGDFREARYGGPIVRLACSDGSQVALKTQAFTRIPASAAGRGATPPRASPTASGRRPPPSAWWRRPDMWSSPTTAC